MDIGVRELKQRLSEIIERAASGETIRVTDRGKPKAILGPVPGAARIELGLEQGWIRPAEELPVARTKRHRAHRASADVLDEDRGE
jgi:prevent-host-death family protein